MAPAAAKALLLTSILFLPLLVGWGCNPSGNFWGLVEPPKAQCEAYSAENLARLTSLGPEVYAPAKLDRLLREPQNTLSNLAYVYVGIALLIAGRRPLVRSLAFACLFLGTGSGLYHASLLPEWRLVDILGVYAVLYHFVAVGVCAALRTPKGDLVASALAWLGAFATGIHRNDLRLAGIKLFDSTYVVVGCVATLALLLLAARPSARSARYLVSVFGVTLLAAVAFAGGLGDRFGGFLARPDGWVQGHALWHVAGAAALLSAYEAFAAGGFDASCFSPATAAPPRA